jgi:hypothetical protein
MFLKTKTSQTLPSVEKKRRQDIDGAGRTLQAKMSVIHSSDPLEREADQAADRLVNLWQNGSLKAPEATSLLAPTRPLIQRRALSSDAGAQQASPEVTQQIQSAQGTGQALPVALQPSLEAAFGMDFSGVRLHTDPRANTLNRDLQARAFATGQDIFFRQGEYKPHTADGLRLLGHELQHVQQQNTEGSLRRSGKYIFKQDAEHSDTPQDEYLATLHNAGTTPEAWDAGMLSSATFLGFSIHNGVHRELYERLRIAEQHLRTAHAGLSDRAIAQNLGIDRVEGDRVPSPAAARQGTRGNVSFHSFGLAIDVNKNSNAFIGHRIPTREITARASALVSGTAYNLLRRSGATRTLFRYHRTASDALREYFRLLQDRPALQRLLEQRGEPYVSQGVDHWMQQIQSDYDNSEFRADFGRRINRQGVITNPGRDPGEGFLNLNEELVFALVEVAGLNWGATFREAKDFMHFDWRRGTIQDGHRPHRH